MAGGTALFHQRSPKVPPQFLEQCSSAPKVLHWLRVPSLFPKLPQSFPESSPKVHLSVPLKNPQWLWLLNFLKFSRGSSRDFPTLTKVFPNGSPDGFCDYVLAPKFPQQFPQRFPKLHWLLRFFQNSPKVPPHFPQELLQRFPTWLAGNTAPFSKDLLRFPHSFLNSSPQKPRQWI